MNSLTGKIFKLITIVLISTLLVTNPGSSKYETYASQRLITYLKGDLCEQLTKKTGDSLRTPCHILIDTARPQIKAAIDKYTRQQNFFLFSIYQTNFAIPPMVPEYHFATLGIFDRFLTYQAETNE